MSVDSLSPTYDVAIVGAGIAGSLLARTLPEKNLRTILIDERDSAPPFFRAERISSLAISELRRLGLGDLIDQVALPLADTAVIKGSKVEKITTDIDFSVRLWQMVAAIRSNLGKRENIDTLTGSVVRADTGAHEQTLRVDCGDAEPQTIRAKLLVVATGASGGFLKNLGVDRKIISRNHSSTFGFDIAPGSDFNLPAASATVRICRDGADYMNLFPTTDGGYRANLFTFWPAGDQRQRDFLKGDPNRVLLRLMPDIHKLTGAWKVSGGIECGCVSVLKSVGFQRPGFVLVGDAYGRICPVAGRGINKAIQDVIALTKTAPRWIAENLPLTPEVLDNYYHDEKRHSYEEWVYAESLSLRQRIVSHEPRQILRRALYHHAPPALREFVWKKMGGGRQASKIIAPSNS